MLPMVHASRAESREYAPPFEPAQVTLDSRDLGALALAEHLNVGVSEQVRRRMVTKTTAQGRLASAWWHIELALNSDTSVGEMDRLESIDCARSLTKMILERKHAAMATHFEALVIASYLPVFQKRALKEAITSHDCVDIYESLAGAFGYIKPLSHGSMPSSLSLEASCLALSARTQRPEFLLYPASPREESSRIRHSNHDSYFIREGSKLAIQQKLIPTELKYDESITMLTMQPMLEKAYKKSGYELDDDMADWLNYPIAVLVAEAAGENIERHEKTLLDSLSRSIVAHHRIAADRLSSRHAA